MKFSVNILSFGLGVSLLLSGCGKQSPEGMLEEGEGHGGHGEATGISRYIPGDPRNQHHWTAPEDVKDFEELYVQNCRGCHSNGSGLSASIALDNPVYLAWIPEEKFRAVITEGVPKTPMPGFGAKGGGALTEEQINILVNGFMLKKAANMPAGLPPYEAPLGNAQRGEALLAKVYGAEKAADWANPSFLALVSNQYLRTLLVIGLPGPGKEMENARNGAPLSAEELSDVVAWLASKRPGAAVTTAPSDVQPAAAAASPAPAPAPAAPVIKPKGGK